MVDSRLIVFANGTYMTLDEFINTYGDKELLNTDSLDKRQYLNIDLANTVMSPKNTDRDQLGETQGSIHDIKDQDNNKDDFNLNQKILKFEDQHNMRHQ